MRGKESQEAKNLIERMTKERGFARPWRSLLAARDPEYMELYHKTAVHAIQGRNALPRKFKEIILVCLDAVTCYEEGFRIHVRNALEAGATEDEILEALEVSSLIGIHCVAAFLPALVEEGERYEGKQQKKG